MRWLGPLLALVVGSRPALAQGEVEMPRVLASVKPELPKGVTPRDADVVLAVTLDPEGTIIDVAVFESGGEDFDHAAMDAVRKWTFSPARKDGRAIKARIRVPVHFVASAPPDDPGDPAHPGPAPSATPSSAPSATPSSAPSAAPSAPPIPSADPSAAPPSAPPDTKPVYVHVSGRKQPPSRGGGDFHVDIGKLALVPRQGNAAKLLELAPSVFLLNEGGDGHAERIYLRGFDAREGQDVEVSVGGVPVNESANLHGAGFADLHFLIPELALSLRVLEGPFDPRQGNYAVAGSAEYELGLAERGISAKYTIGTFGSHRLLALWGPPDESVHTFGGAELAMSDGFGQNRQSKLARAMGQYEGTLGETGTYRIAATAYANEYGSAGLLREDDVASGRKGFFDTYDVNQGGSGSRFSFSSDIASRTGDIALYQQLFLVHRNMRLRENFTGFLADTQTALQSPHGQRGDLFDLSVSQTTFGARGHARWDKEWKTSDKAAPGAARPGPSLSVELGYYARGDQADSRRDRIGADTGDPYKVDGAFGATLADIGLYGDVSFRPHRFLTLRGGVRADMLFYDVLDKCAVKTVTYPRPSADTVDQSCFDQERFGEHREPEERSTATGFRAMPRGSLLVGPFSGFTLSLSAGTGIRSMDPSYITQEVPVAFASVDAYEGGISYSRKVGAVNVNARSVVFGTHVDRDLIFSLTEGRNVLSQGTTRVGWIGAARVTGDFFDASAHVTWTKSQFDDTGLLVPYVPDVVARLDGSLFGDLPWKVLEHPISASFAVGAPFVGRRALPYGQRSDTIFTVDASVTAQYRWVSLGVAATNLFDVGYRLAEFQYASNWNNAASPTLVPSRHFAAGAPRQVLFTVGLRFGGPDE